MGVRIFSDLTGGGAWTFFTRHDKHLALWVGKTCGIAGSGIGSFGGVELCVVPSAAR